MAFTVTNLGTGANTSGASVSITTLASVPAGSAIVIGISERTSSLTSQAISDGTNTYTRITSGIQGGNLAGSIYVAKNVSALPSGSTITVTKGAADNIAVSALFVTGVDTTTCVDAATPNSTGVNGNPSVQSGLPTNANCLYIGFAAVPGNTGTFTQDSTHGAFATPPNEASSGTASGTNRRINGGSLVDSGTNRYFYSPTYSSTPAASVGSILALIPGTGGTGGGGSTFSSSGSATVSLAGKSLANATLSSAGIAAFSAAGKSQALSTASMAGVGSVSPVGKSLATSTLTSAGQASTSLVGKSLFLAALASVGTAVASFVGSSVAAGSATLSAAGAATVSFVGKSLASAIAAITGSSSVSVVGKSTASADLTIAGSSSAAFAGPSVLSVITIRGTSAAVFWGVGQTGSLLRIPFSDGARFADGATFQQYGRNSFFTLPEEGDEWTNLNPSGDPWTQIPDASDSWSTVN